MKKIFPFLLCLFLFGTAHAKIVVLSPIFTSAICRATEDQGNTGSETFDTNPGYDESWYESVSAGCTVDEDYDVSGVGCGFMDEGARCATDGDASDDAVSYKDYGSEIDPAYHRVYVYINSSNEDSSADDNIIRLQNSIGTTIFEVEYGKDAGGNHILKVNTPGSDSVQISLQKVYRVEIYSSNASDEWAWRVYELQADDVTFSLLDNDGSGYTGHASDDPGDGIQQVLLGWQSQDKAVDAYFDNSDLDSTGWIGE